MTAGSYDIFCTPGEPLEVTITVLNPDESKIGLASWDVFMHVRRTSTSLDTVAELSTANGKILKNITNGTITISLSEEDTADLVNGVYSMELHTIGPKKVVVRLLQGFFNVG